MKKLIDVLNIEMQIDINNNYHAQFNDYDEFTEIYNKLEKSNLITKNSPQSYLNEHDCHVEFDGDDYYVYLEGDFNIDEYTLTITK